MSRLSELFDDARVLSQVEENSKIEEYFETLDISAENRILELTLSKMDKEQLPAIVPCKKKHHIFNRKRLLLAALVAVLAGTIAVSAQEGGLEKVFESIGLKNGLRERIHLSPEEQSEDIFVEDIVEDENTSDEHFGVKISVKQAVSDGEDAYVYLAVEVAESVIPDQWTAEGKRLYFRENKIQVGNGEPEKVNFALHQEEDGSIYGIIHFPLDKIEKGNVTVSLNLNNLDFGVHKDSEEGWDITRLVEGEWNLKWNLSCEKIAKTYEIDAVVDAHEGLVTLKKAVVSPLSVKIEGSIEGDDPTYSQLSCYIYQVILKDGTLVNYDSSYLKEKDGTIIMKFYFKKMFSVDDVAGVIVNDEYLYFQ